MGARESYSSGNTKILIKYGIPFDVTKQSQQIKLSDLKNNDLLIAMDTENLTDLLDLSNGQWDDKIKLFVLEEFRIRGIRVILKRPINLLWKVVANGYPIASIDWKM